METYFSIALFTGLASSFHCIGMCGPIALAWPVGGLNKQQSIVAKVLYNLGRVLTYSSLGFIFGLLGKQFYIIGLQQNLSILIGIFILIMLLPRRLFTTHFNYKITHFISKTSRNFWENKTAKSFFTLGILNGLLPCGMVYIALAGAASMASGIGGATFMAIFGIATMPVMLSINFLPSLLSLKSRQKITKFLPVYSLLLGIFFVIRGLGLGIPIVSPAFENNKGQTSITICHGGI